ncbi:MAG: PEP-CTERM sorting domain-containing protein [Gammaproteobacteria bacterium]|nr:PEP-CTERM sorting domain-containing protein [Gammaproteobacteria bacterium]
MKYRFICLLLLLGFTVHSQAVIISFEPGDQSISLGGSATVDLRVSGLGDEILTGFDLYVGFDDSILAFQSFTFGTGLDVFGFGTLTDVLDFGGVVNVYELSFDFDDDLRDFQPDDFVLGTLTFVGLDFGTSALDILQSPLSFSSILSGEYVLDDLLGFEIASELQADLGSGSIIVPEPGALVLLMSGLLGIGLHRKTILA